MSENISSNNIYQSQIPSLTDAADIQDAFKLYHFGTTTEPANAGLLTEGIAKHLYDLQTLKAPIAGPTFTGTLTAPTINASTALQIGGTAITSTAAELNILDGVTSSTAELNLLDGVTSSTAELNILDGVTSSTAELNILDGVTSTASEINLVDGSVAGTIVNNKAVVYGASGQVNATTLQIGGVSITSTAAELNLLDNSVAGTIVNSKAVVYGAAGEVNATTLQIGGVSALASGTALSGAFGGTGVANTGKTITLGGNLTTSGANNVTFTTSGATTVTLPTTGTLVASGAIVNADINASAAIVDTKLATISTGNKVSLSALDIDGGTDIGAAIDNADLMIIDDGGAGTNRKVAVTRIPTYVFSKVSGDVAINSSGVATVTGADATSIVIGTTDGNGADTTLYPVLVGANTTTSQTPHVDGLDLSYNASTGALAATTFVGNLTGTANSANAGSVYSTGTDTKTGNRRIFVGASQPNSSTPYGQSALQIGDIWIDT
jgi:hypothetical protein